MSNRHNPFKDNDSGYDRLDILSNTNVEWMSINYRMDKIANLSLSSKRVILILFQNNFQFFPTLREIRDQLIMSQEKILESKLTDKTQLQSKKAVYKEQWQFLFKLADLGDIDQPLSKKILSDPTHNITKLLLYIYSMESFIYTDLNLACRQKNTNKIQYYGAFAAALSYILYFANEKQKKATSERVHLYRGINQSEEEIKQLYKVNSTIHLTGYTSTSKSIEIAVAFALENTDPTKVPVILEIDFKSKYGMFELGKGQSAFPEENEVLV